jgi:membrane protein
VEALIDPQMRRRLEHLIGRGTVFAPVRGAFHLFVLLRRAVLAAIDHDLLTVAQATAYSAIVALFPSLIVSAAIVALLPDAAPFRLQMSLIFDRVLPSDVTPVLEAYFAGEGKNPQTARALLGSIVVSLSGASNVMSTLMEGFRRAHNLPEIPGSFWLRRGRALALVPLSLVPMALASALVVFGHHLMLWIAGQMPGQLQTSVYILGTLLRWTMALTGSVGILAVIYHLGTDLSRHMRDHLEEAWIREPWLMFRRDWSWRKSLPGAVLATLLWFVTTLLFGYYVTRFANYGHVYGSLGAAIALLFWLYLTAAAILIGSEFNAQLALHRRKSATCSPEESE